VAGSGADELVGACSRGRKGGAAGLATVQEGRVGDDIALIGREELGACTRRQTVGGNLGSHIVTAPDKHPVVLLSSRVVLEVQGNVLTSGCGQLSLVKGKFLALRTDVDGRTSTTTATAAAARVTTTTATGGKQKRCAHQRREQCHTEIDLHWRYLLWLNNVHPEYLYSQTPPLVITQDGGSVKYMEGSMLSENEIREVLLEARTIAVVGLSANPERDSNGVARYLQRSGYTIIPVNPNLNGPVLGARPYASLAEVPVPIDIVDIFRRPDAVPPLVDEAITIGARVVWMQLGIESLEAAQRAQAAGLKVVMNRCIAIEHRRLSRM
jgi:uncharacterized protein